MKWRIANHDDLADMGRKHWREAETKVPITAGSAFAWVREGHPVVEVLDESPASPSEDKGGEWDDSDIDAAYILGFLASPQLPTDDNKQPTMTALEKELKRLKELGMTPNQLLAEVRCKCPTLPSPAPVSDNNSQQKPVTP